MRGSLHKYRIDKSNYSDITDKPTIKNHGISRKSSDDKISCQKIPGKYLEKFEFF